MAQLPPVIPLPIIAEWLPKIFPEGSPNRRYLVREMAAKTLFVMIYAGAVEGLNRYARPNQVTKMTDAQSIRCDDESREQWIGDSQRSGGLRHVQECWYAENTREPIRDETLRNGLVAVGAVVERRDLPTTSAKPRYAIAAPFAHLLAQLASNPPNAQELVEAWQAAHLSSASLSRVTLLRRGIVHSSSSGRLSIAFPNGEARMIRPGPSSTITKAVVEEFAPKFLGEPGVIFLSESGDKVIARDDELAKSLGLNLDYSRNLPDIILADASAAAPKIVFVEVVATDGPISEERKRALLAIGQTAGFQQEQIYFLSAFADRKAPAFRKLVGEIAWGTFVWFLSEPENLLVFRDGRSEPACLLNG